MTITTMAQKVGYVGSARGDRMWLEISLEPQHGRFETVEHKEIESYTRLSISGYGKFQGNRSVGFSGQIIDRVRQIGRPADDWTRAELAKLCEVWDRWHLNDMRAGCAHMPAGADLGTYCPKVDADGHAYKYGTAWLVEPLPEEVVAQVRAWGRRLDGDRGDI